MIECIPNVSEGRNIVVLNALSTVIQANKYTHLLHVDANADANRTVFTIVGEPKVIETTMLHFYEVALESIDMRVQNGVHPRIGAVYVCPFVPFYKQGLTSTIDFSRGFAQKLAETFGLPVYLYELAAFKEERRNLAVIRRGEYERLAFNMQERNLLPDFGPNYPHPTAGATAIGVRDFLIAYNISLNTNDLSVAKKIAAQIRSSSDTESSLPNVKAIGWEMPAYNCVQISTNLTNYRETGIIEVFDTVKYLAAGYGIDISGSEVIGMLPLEAIKTAGFKICEKEGIKILHSEADYIQIAVKYLGLSLHNTFIPAEKILEYRMHFKE